MAFTLITNRRVGVCRAIMGMGFERGPEDRRPRVSTWLEPFPVDVSDRGGELVVAAALPGLDRDDIGVRARRHSVEITADFSDAEGDMSLERGPVSRSIDLPERVDKSQVSATYLDGVLFVTLPKTGPTEQR